MKILIIDKQENADIAAAILKSHHETFVAESEKGIREKMLLHKPDMALITVDEEKIDYKRFVLETVRRSEEFAGLPVGLISTYMTQPLAAAAKVMNAEIVIRPYEPLEFLGKMEEICEKMKPVKERLDTVTKLHKREFTEERIKEIFEQKSGTLFIIDVAKFRFASQPISEEIAAMAAEVVSEKANHFGAILGVQKDRKLIGYLPGINERSICLSWAKNIISGIQEKLGEQKVYVSIGFACNDEKASDYKELYQLCDRALKLSRERGSNMASYY